MSTLHIVSSSPFTSDALDLALDLAAKGDAILLIEDGIYGAADAQVNVLRLASVTAGLHFYVLKEDMSARGLFTPLADFNAVSYVGFVELVCRHNTSVNWS